MNRKKPQLGMGNGRYKGRHRDSSNSKKDNDSTNNSINKLSRTSQRNMLYCTTTVPKKMLGFKTILIKFHTNLKKIIISIWVSINHQPTVNE